MTKDLQRIENLLLKDHGITIDTSSLVDEFTNGEADTIEALRSEEHSAFLAFVRLRFREKLTMPWKDTPANVMRRKIYALFVHRMDYTKDGMLAWVKKYSHASKPLSKHTYHELVTLVSQAERVYNTYVKSVHQSR